MWKHIWNFRHLATLSIPIDDKFIKMTKKFFTRKLFEYLLQLFIIHNVYDPYFTLTLSNILSIFFIIFVSQNSFHTIPAFILKLLEKNATT